MFKELREKLKKTEKKRCKLYNRRGIEGHVL